MFQAGQREGTLSGPRSGPGLWDLVVDAVRLGRRDPVAALAGDARAARRRAGAVLPGRAAADARDRDDRDLLPLRDPAVGADRFGIPFDFAQPFAFVLARPGDDPRPRPARDGASPSTFVLYRHANALSNMLEWPVLLVTGLLVPLALLPGWVLPISWVFAPTWGMRALRDAALGGNPWPDLAMTLVLGAVYVLIGALALRYFERAARKHATLALT